MDRLGPGLKPNLARASLRGSRSSHLLKKKTKHARVREEPATVRGPYITSLTQPRGKGEDPHAETACGAAGRGWEEKERILFV